MLRDVILKWFLRHYEHNTSMKRKTFGIIVASILKNLYLLDEERYEKRRSECSATIARLEMLLFELHGGFGGRK